MCNSETRLLRLVSAGRCPRPFATVSVPVRAQSRVRARARAHVCAPQDTHAANRSISRSLPRSLGILLSSSFYIPLFNTLSPPPCTQHLHVPAHLRRPRCHPLLRAWPRRPRRPPLSRPERLASAPAVGVRPGPSTRPRLGAPLRVRCAGPGHRHRQAPQWPTRAVRGTATAAAGRGLSAQDPAAAAAPGSAGRAIWEAARSRRSSGIRGQASSVGQGPDTP